MSIGDYYSFQANNGDEVLLRPVVEEDAGDIVRHVQSIVMTGIYLQKETPRSLKDEIEFIHNVHKKGNMYTAVERRGKVVGIARIVKGDLEMKKHTGCFRTWIHPDSQGLGIGKEVMKYTLKWGKENNLHKLWLTVFSGNEKATEIYKKFGFFIEGRQKEQLFINERFEDEIYMAYFFK